MVAVLVFQDPSGVGQRKTGQQKKTEAPETTTAASSG